jgi:hypothetical protein
LRGDLSFFQTLRPLIVLPVQQPLQKRTGKFPNVAWASLGFQKGCRADGDMSRQAIHWIGQSDPADDELPEFFDFGLSLHASFIPSLTAHLTKK